MHTRISILGILVTASLTAIGCSSSSSSSTATSGSSGAGTTTGGTTSTGSTGGSSGGATSGGTTGQVPTDLKNADTYAFGDVSGDDAWAAAAGAYQLTCVQAEAAPLVPGTCYAVITADKTMSLLSADGTAVVHLENQGAIFFHIPEATPNPETWTYELSASGSDATSLSLILYGDGRIDFQAKDPGHNSGHGFAYPGRVLRSGTAVPAEFATYAGTHAMVAPAGSPKYDLIVDADGSVTVNQTDPNDAGNPVYTTHWTGGVQPLSQGTGDYLLYRPDSDGGWFDGQIQNSSGALVPGFSFSVGDGLIQYAAHGFLVMNPVR